MKLDNKNSITIINTDIDIKDVTECQNIGLHILIRLKCCN